MSSTLVETVSINYEDFSDSFLTCGTCLSVYNGEERTPKLLCCSHTVCLSCLEHIVAQAQQQSQNQQVTSITQNQQTISSIQQNQQQDQPTNSQIPGQNLQNQQSSETYVAITFRCPICRETIVLPRGGISAFPPSFIVNQLLDLMGRQRRDVVPKCSRHPQTELMFCESCDVVFCLDCTEGSNHAGSHHSGMAGGGTGPGSNLSASSAHTIVPFSVAIKRMSEILLYKASLCIKNLDEAGEAVEREIARLEAGAEQCIEAVTKAFQEVTNIVEKRKQEVMTMTRKVRDEKKKSLKEQLEIIEAEKRKVQDDCQGLQHQVDVRNITTKIGDLNEKLDISATLMDPRENAFMRFEHCHNDSIELLKNSLIKFGKISISKTFPGLCTASGINNAMRDNSGFLNHINNSMVNNNQGINMHTMSIGNNNVNSSQGYSSHNNISVGNINTGSGINVGIGANAASIHLEYFVTITTVDYHGNNRTTGGDPVEVRLTNISKDNQLVPTVLEDNENGTYTLSFIPFSSGQHRLQIFIFNRPIKDSPFIIEVTDHIDPILKVGSTGSGANHFKQPVAIFHGLDNKIYVLDTGNSRIKVMDDSLRLDRILTGKGLEQHSATGMCLMPGTGHDKIVLVNWRTKQVTLIGLDGALFSQFSSDLFVEPISVAANHFGEIIVADNGIGKCFVFDVNGSLLNSFGSKGHKHGQFKLVTSVYALPKNGEIIVCDNRLQLFTRGGQFIQELNCTSHDSNGTLGSGKGSYGGVCVDSQDRYLATRLEKGRCVVQVFNAERKWMFDIDSQSDKLKRPSGLTTSEDGHVFVVDLGNDCLKKYRYL